jgi:hypothetical protein
MISKTLHRKLNIKQHEPQESGQNSAHYTTLNTVNILVFGCLTIKNVRIMVDNY